METSNPTAQTPSDIITRIGLQSAERTRQDAERVERLRSEYLSVFPSLIAALQAEGRYTSVILRDLNVLYGKCFEGCSSEEIAQTFSFSKNCVPNYKKNAVSLILEYAARGLITVSEDLKVYLVNTDQSIRYVSATKSIEKAAKIVDPVMYMKQKVRGRIVEILTGFPTPIQFNQEDVESIVQVIEGSRAKTENELLYYVYVVTKNWALSRIKKVLSDQNLQKRNEEKIIEEEMARQKHVDFQAAEQEFIEFMGMVSEEKGDRMRNKLKQLGILYFTIFKKENDAQLQERYPDSSRACRDQWRKRARDYIWNLATPNLRSFLKFWTHAQREEA